MNFLEHSEDAEGFPTWEFEAFYQQGLSCFVWGLPKPLIRQAFKKICTYWMTSHASIAMWQTRAFVYGAHGRRPGSLRRIPEGYRWPTPPDPSWELVVCVYPNGFCDIDLAHPVSRRFSSEDNGFFALPTDDRSLMNRQWFEAMGFNILDMRPAMRVRVAERRQPYLKPV